jgi:two-component system nitrate/nitrite response regulator NarL
MVDSETDPKLIREVMNFPDVDSVGWVCQQEEDVPKLLEYTNRLISGDLSHHPDAVESSKPKRKKLEKKKNEISLTVRQAQVLQLVQTRGASNKAIAKMLGLTESTVKLHMGAILKKFGVRNRTQLAVFSQQKN